MSATCIVLVDDHRLVARSLQAYLDSFPDLRVVGIARSAEELLERVAEWNPDVIVQDLLLPGGMDGIAATRLVLERRPGVRVIALTASVDEARMVGALRAGAAGYLRKDADPEVLVSAIRAAVRGRTYVDPSLREAGPATAEDELTPRETEVLRQLAFGRSNREIAGTLLVSEETVKSHVGHVLAKLRVDNRTQAIVQALKRGLVSLDD